MQVILLENVQNLGVLGDSVRVRPGYARNFLIPRGKALPATPANLAEFEGMRETLERQQAEVLSAAQKRADAVDGVSIIVRHKVGEGGKLFGSVGSNDVAAALADAGHEINRASIRIPGQSIRELGQYPVGVQVHAGIEAIVQLTVEGEGGERAEDYLPEEDEVEDLDAQTGEDDAGEVAEQPEQPEQPESPERPEQPEQV